jgi:hypothetical protein
MARGLIIGTPREKPRQGWACLTCGAWFEKDRHREFERHSISCAAVNEHIERDRSPRNVLGIFGGSKVGLDSEFERWVKRNARAIIEKRVRM